MSGGIAKTIMLTTKCSGGCTHCPFSNKELDKLFIDLVKLEKILHLTSDELIVLSGGEPFEHPYISNRLDLFLENAKPFRVATGGFVRLTP